MIIYYSNEGHRWASVESLYPETGNLMLSFFMFAKNLKPNRRFARILKARRLGRRIRGAWEDEADTIIKESSRAR